MKCEPARLGSARPGCILGCFTRGRTKTRYQAGARPEQMFLLWEEDKEKNKEKEKEKEDKKEQQEQEQQEKEEKDFICAEEEELKDGNGP